MELTPEMITLGTELAAIAGRSVESIYDKIRTVKKKENKDEIISNLDEIINDLISDKNKLIQICHVYEENLATQKIKEEEIDYITTSIIPILEDLVSQGENEGTEKIQETMSIAKSLVSKETLNIMQMLGFNFKNAIGEPLTKLVSSFIESKMINSSDKTLGLQLLAQQREVEYLKICQDEESFNRMMQFYNR